MKFINNLIISIEAAMESIANGQSPNETGIGKLFKELLKADSDKHKELLTKYKPIAEEYFRQNPPDKPSREYLVQKEMQAIIKNREKFDGEDQEDKKRTYIKREAPTRPVRPKGERDRTSYMFKDVRYGKGTLALTIVKAFIEENPQCNFKTLKAAFPDELLRSYGVIQDVESAIKKSGAKPRYFMKSPIDLTDGTQIVVSNQYTTDNFQPLLRRIKELGFTVEAVTE